MHWLILLGIVVLLVALSALTGAKPKGTRPVARTRLMTLARVFLGILALIFFVLALRSYGLL
ncbi:MAG: hypothetical protein R3234_08755 [Thermoanaerobaculia bacterium]|nr:hypothetical protein [Thermoanaerobaculia bacterium]